MGLCRLVVPLLVMALTLSAAAQDDVLEWAAEDARIETIDDDVAVNDSLDAVADTIGAGIDSVATAREVGLVISDDELSSPMMLDATEGAYKESFLAKFFDFYNEWPITTLLCAIAVIAAIFYVARRIAIAMA